MGPADGHLLELGESPVPVMAVAASGRRRTRSEVVQEYGHPWPWYERELVEEYAVEADRADR